MGVDTLIHTAGPFQDQNYAVARAAIEAGCNYIDLADGRQFVSGIESLDSAAKARGVTVISGASSVPGLSSAVIERYLPQFQELRSIEMGISSGARAPGIATVTGIFGYCGKPLRRLQGGAWITSYGWLDLRRYRFPRPLGSRWIGSCDIPDLELFPKRYPTARTVTFHAGFASDLGHLVVWSIAELVRAGVLRSALPFAAPLNRLSRWIEPLVSDKGGMFVKLEGIGHDGDRKSIAWHLLAAENHGPHIPCGASIALTQKLAHGPCLPSGAMPCVGLLTVEEYLAPLKGLNIQETAA
jgi:saccharopine dehydrogenase-like NADP-dependent oxidoreductase